MPTEEHVTQLSVTADQSALLLISVEQTLKTSMQARENLREMQASDEPLPEGVTHEEIMEEINISLHMQKGCIELIEELRECILFLEGSTTPSGIILPEAKYNG